MNFAVQAYWTDGLKPFLRMSIQLIFVCLLSVSLSSTAFAQLERTTTEKKEQSEQTQTKLAPLKIQTDRSVSTVVDLDSHYRALTKSTATLAQNINIDAANKNGIALSISEKGGLLTYTPPESDIKSQTFSYEICETEPFTATSSLQYTKENGALVAKVSVVRKSAVVQEKTDSTSTVLQEKTTSQVLTKALDSISKTETTEKTQTEIPTKTQTETPTKTETREKVSLITATTTGFEAEARAQLEAQYKLTDDARKKLAVSLAEGESSQIYSGDTTHTDNVNCASGDVEVTVNDAPQLLDDKAATDQGVAVTIDVTANDADLNNLDLASLSIVPSKTEIPGKLAIDVKTGLIRFAPNADFSGETSFDYQICNRYANTELAAAKVVRRATLYAKTAVVAERVVLEQQQTQSKVVLQKQVLGINEREAAEYSAEQPHEGQCAKATVTVAVNPQMIDAVNDKASTDMGKAVVLDLAANDIDLKNLDLASIKLMTKAANGSVEVDSATGLMLYTPKDGFTGQDSFDYQICNRYANVAEMSAQVVKRDALYAKEAVAKREASTTAELKYRTVTAEFKELSEAVTYNPEVPHAADCATATVEVTVNPAEIDAVNDKATTDMNVAVPD